MNGTEPALMHRQFMHGLSSGVFVLALAGALCLFFATWCGVCVQLGLDPLAAQAGEVDFPGLWFVLNVSGLLAIGWGGLQVRRKAGGFKWAEIQQASEKHREQSRSIQKRFLWSIAAEWIAITVSVLLALHNGRTDLIGPGVALGISLHFAPLAYFFRVRPYYFTAAAGSAAALIALIVPLSSLPTAERLLLVSFGLGFALWITAIYLIVRADNLARAWDETVVVQ